MKVSTNKKLTNRIIKILLVVMLFNFISPTMSHADIGGELFKPIAQLLIGIGDVVISTLQKYFIGFGNISPDPGVPGSDGTAKTYSIKYSPGIIFSGTVAGLKVNFVDAKKSDNEEREDFSIEYEYKETFGSINDVKPEYGLTDQNSEVMITTSNDEWYKFWDTSEKHIITRWKTTTTNPITNEPEEKNYIGEYKEG